MVAHLTVTKLCFHDMWRDAAQYKRLQQKLTGRSLADHQTVSTQQISNC